MPIIGITCGFEEREDGKEPRHHLPAAYADAVFEAGGTPVLLAAPPEEDEAEAERLLAAVDGLLLTGGPDIPPRAYGERPEPQTRPMAERRHAFERLLLRLRDGERRGRRLAVLGICLGCQMINVHRGGTLIQHLRTGVVHRSPRGRRYARHEARLEGEDLDLERALGGRAGVVFSSHHQAAGRVGEGLKVVARAPDGVVEALRGDEPDLLLGLQWHPEAMKGSAHRRRVFRAFAAACAGRAE